MHRCYELNFLSFFRSRHIAGNLFIFHRMKSKFHARF
ncbi:hypothetical protein OIU77_014394 [Salix suchowensis]|uniref:Uncharacterized protein n=1 Tax=Salix suchowensis TaxID=1278906 RepID=A0ABQ8ZX32_9ROSI|nr:hypothetical protein OIU77_014394 [Salix suchowensis]